MCGYGDDDDGKSGGGSDGNGGRGNDDPIYRYVKGIQIIINHRNHHNTPPNTENSTAFYKIAQRAKIHKTSHIISD